MKKLLLGLLVGLVVSMLAPSARGLTIQATFDSTITNDPNAAAIMAGINQAIQTIQTNIADNLTVKILFKIDTNIGLGQSSTWFNSFSYGSYLTALRASASSASDNAAMTKLPVSATDPVVGNNLILLTLALARNMGLAAGFGPDGFDATISLNTPLMNLTRPPGLPNKYDLIATVEHEVNEVLGTTSALSPANVSGPIRPIDLFRYTTNLARSWTTAGDDAYFSVDGTNLLARFNMSSSGDYADYWSSTGVKWAPPGMPVVPQVQDAFATPGTFADNSPNEFAMLDVIGYTLTGNTPPPVITTNPQGQTVFAGANVTFTVTATGLAPLTYQWYYNLSPILNATSSTLTLNAVTVNQSGSYHVQVTNPGGSVNSQFATLNVNPVPVPPSITQQPQNLAALIGSTATFTVTAIGDAPLSYQWFFNSTNLLAGETNSILVLSGVATNQSGNYRVVITNAVGSVTSVNATLTVGRLTPALTWAAPAQVVYGTALGASQLNATSTVPGAFVYSPPSGTVLSVGTNVLSVVFTPTDQFNYNTNSATVNLVVTRAPLTVTADTKGRVYGQANPPLTITYTGFVNGETPVVLTALPAVATTAGIASPPGIYPITISGATAANYSITHVDGVLAVTALAPIITTQPTNVTAFITTVASFQVGAGGYPSPAFQWFYNGSALPDATNSSLAVAVTATNQAGNYQVVITNVAGSITSSVAVLTVSRLVPGITWPTPAPVTYGTTLGASQLNASTVVPGTTAYTPASGTLLPAGTQALTNVFTPTDQTKYVVTTNTVGLVVTPAALTATAGSQSRLFGFTNQPLTVSYSGFVNGETSAVLTTPAVPATVADINSLPGTYPITLSGATAANYAVTHVAGSITIAANQAPSATFATNNVVVLEDSGPASFSSFAVFSAGPALESAQTVTSVTVGNNNPALFAVAPALTSGTLTFTPATNANGVATVTVIAQDDGGTGGGGVDRSTNTFTITVTAVNDAPGFTVLPAVGPAGAVWTPRESQRAWTAIASSADGSRLAAVVGPETTGQIYVSTNAGLSWVASESDRNWMTVAMSSDGLTVVAAGTSTDIVVSKDGGMTWLHTTAGQRAWQSVATSADGNRLAVAAFNGQLYTSADGGTNWTARAMVTDWAGIASSADGTRLVAVDLDGGAAASYLGGRIYTSTDGGTNWTQAGAPAGSWAAVASSGDGTRLVAIQSGGQIYVSTDGGANWTARDSSRTWQAVASSADGLKLLAVENNGLIYVSTDGGTNWVPRGSVRFWSGVASSADGSRLAAVENDGLIYTSTLLLENAGPQSIPQFATALSAGPANESAQVVSFVLTNDNNALFSAQPAVSASGTLTFTPVTNTFGSATVTVVAQDNGGAANGGTNASAPQTFTITVAAVNQPPSVTFATNNVVVFKDSATTTLGGHATFSVGPANETSQTILGFTVANNNNALFSVQPALDTGGTLTFTPAASAFGTATVTVVVQDSGGTALGGVDRATNIFTIMVSRLVPALTWSTPAAITYGTALGAGQLNASAGAVPGAFAYVPPTGTVLPTGTNLLTANFTPTDTSVYENNSATVSLVVTQAALTVTADNQTRAFGLANPTLTLSYTGFVNGETVANLTSPATAATAADVNSLPGGYPITAGGATGTNYSITHVAGLLTVTAVPPVLVLNPTNQTVIVGADVTHVAAATGGPAPTYQWYFNATNLLAGATNATLLLTSAQPTQAGTYTVVAANVGGSVTSVVATLTVLVPPTISAQPQSRTNNALTDATFTVTAAGSTPLVYQWYSNAVAVADATNASLTVSNVTTLAAGSYQVIVTNAAGAVTSSVAALTVDLLTPSLAWAAPTPVTYGTVLGAGQLNASTPVAGAFAYSPASGTLLPAGTHTLTNVFTPANPAAYVSTTGTVSLVVSPAVLTATAVSQARLFGVANAPLTVNYSGFVNGETAAILTTPAVPATVADINSPSGVYPITISGATAPNYTVTHVTGTITVLAPPTISVAPVSRTNNALTDATFSVTAAGTAPLVYQWYSNTVAVTDATNTSLTVSNVTTAAAGNYQVIITNAAGAATSSVVTLTVNLLTPSVTWATPTSVTYGTVLGAGQLNASTPVPGTVAYTPTAGTLLPAGTHTLTNVFTPTDQTTHRITTITVSLVVNPAALTATAASQTRVFNTANGPLTVSYTGFVNGETSAILTSPAVPATLADINSVPGTYPIALSGATAANYTVTHVAGTLTVTLNLPPSVTFVTNNVVVLEDSGAQTVSGFATIAPEPMGGSGQSITSVTVGNDNPVLFAVAPALTGGTLTFTPATNANGVATLTVIVQDDGGTAGGGVDRSTNIFTITVTAVNDAPSFRIPPLLGPAGATWTAQFGAPATNWASIASSADGMKLAAVAYGREVYTSTDSGTNWTVRRIIEGFDGIPFTLNCIASSADGTKLVAGDYGGQFWTSTDSGVTWTPQGPSRGWTSVVSSADGTKLAAVERGGRIYTSTDSGVTWTERESDRAWAAIASSADGAKLVAVVEGGQIYTSTDAGLSWTARFVDSNWSTVASSADGTKLVAGGHSDYLSYGPPHYGNYLFTSTDSGVTWTARENVRQWRSVASSADGARLIAVADGAQNYNSAVADGGQIYTSTDSGVTWTARENIRNWAAAASSADGSRLVAVDATGASGRIYTSVGPLVECPILVLENSGAYATNSFASSISPGSINESAQVVSFLVTNDNNALFGVQPAIDTNGTLSFTPAVNAFGVATVTINAQDNGGTANGGTNASAPQTFTITVTFVNQAPSITFATNTVVVPANSGLTTRSSHATFNVGPANESGQTILGFTVANDNNPLFSVQPAIDAGGMLTFTPAASAFGSTIVTVVAQDSGGTANGGVDRATNTFTITVTAAPVITTPPADAAVNALSTTNFSVTAVGTTPLAYQWLFNGAALPGQTGATLTLSAVTTNQAGSYRVIITNAIGAVTSSVVTLTVNRLTPAITWSTPTAITYGTALGGGQLNASAGAVAGALVYSPAAGAVPGAGTVPLNVTFTPTDSSVYVPNTASVSLTINRAILTATAQNQARIYGQANPTLTVGYSGFVNGDTAAVLLTPATASTTADGTSLPGSYAITASGATAANYTINHVNGTLSVTADAPVINGAPVSQTNAALTDATFSVGVTGTAPLVYQWYSNTVAVTAGTNASFTVSNVTAAAVGNYQVIITNVAGATTSSVVTLTVNLLTPSMTWATPTPVTYGAVLGAGQLNASTPVAGAFAYAPASGILLPAGTHTLTNVFTPANPAAYVSTTGTVSLVVNQAALAATAVSQTRAFGTPNGPLTVNYAGFVNSETVANLTSAATASTLADINSLPGGHAITASGAAGTNYSITHVAGLLTVTAVPPVLVLSPTNQTVIAGVDVTQVALATGGPAPAYQWYLNVTNALAGATNSTLVVTNAQLAQAGDYTVVAANVGGSVTSAVATLTVLVPPSISAQPQPIVVLPGSNVLFSVTAGGTAPPAYQWRFNGNPLPGETNAQLAVPNAQALVAGPYSVSVTNVAGGVLSSNAVLSIGSGPAITTHPLDLVSIVGVTAVFTVNATGTPAPAFIWQKNGFPLAGETNSTLVLTNLLLGHAGTYSVLVSNVFGTAPSSNATLQVVQPVAVTISGQPQNQTATAGATVTFNVTAAGAPPPSYQWLKGVTPIPNANGPSLSLTNISLADAAGYSVQVFNAVNMVPSATATLTVQVPPVITNQPQSVLTNLGANATFNVGATGLPAPTYQWFKGGLLIAPATGGFVGQTSSNLNVLTVQPAQTGTYVVVVANAAGSVTSAPVTLNLVSAPVITLQPADVALDRTNLIPPAPVLFSVTATGVPPLTYQWRFNGTSLPGATNASLVWTNLARSNSGYFSVQVANPGGATLSSNVLLRIRLAQDMAAPIRPPGGGFRIAFGDMDGAGMVASNLSKFEIQFSTNLVDWTPASSALGLLNGKFILDDANAGATSRRFYRVIER